MKLLSLLFVFFYLFSCASYRQKDFYIMDTIHIKAADAKKIGEKIWYNEASLSEVGLTTWNKAEDFPSLGIGHFIWQPKNKTSIFGETWPSFMEFVKEKNVHIPDWLTKTRHAPWSSREDFLSKLHSPQMKQLRRFLLQTIDLQVSFIIKRLQESLPKMVRAEPNPLVQEKITRNFYTVAESSNGIYALIDYVNFKGEGISNPSSYNYQGWGLRQVLTEMGDTYQKNSAVSAFSKAAKFVLTRRVANAPKDESHWLRGWYNRVNTYLQKL